MKWTVEVTSGEVLHTPTTRRLSCVTREALSLLHTDVYYSGAFIDDNDIRAVNLDLEVASGTRRDKANALV